MSGGLADRRFLGGRQCLIAALLPPLLKPLGKPAQNAVKHFATCFIENLSQNPKWLDEATQIIYEHWKNKNAKKPARVVLRPDIA
jgi:hypothetical protein